jgi:hypothetical protein
MNNPQPPSTAYCDAIFTARLKHKAAPKTIAGLLDDANAIAEWSNNLKKIRQKESETHAKNSS